MANFLDPDQVECSAHPDLGPNCLQRLAADNKSHGKYNVDKEFKSKENGKRPINIEQKSLFLCKIFPFPDLSVSENPLNKFAFAI